MSVIGKGSSAWRRTRPGRRRQSHITQLFTTRTPGGKGGDQRARPRTTESVGTGAQREGNQVHSLAREPVLARMAPAGQLNCSRRGHQVADVDPPREILSTVRGAPRWEGNQGTPLRVQGLTKRRA